MNLGLTSTEPCLELTTMIQVFSALLKHRTPYRLYTFLMIYLRDRERERESARVRGRAEGETKKNLSRLLAEHKAYAGLDPITRRS